ncbi:hypothetical protein HZ992_20550 [Rhizobacter sp. AJA081-3]|uniref:hypothetical protein n=1 Tax=Rhizobacter sp. AJA081-3 TaxID=2753607 RepID=UPI001ADFD54F|nr:hypothetical protein [Rhizobacter sp. AJA081-3]QTN22512.1 hypothetical protein HZ992_20550 [Rhizobacter sp. AJA081-3]
MQRRTLLKLGIGATVILVAAGGGISMLQPALSNGHLSTNARAVMHAVARAVLDGALPSAPDERDRAIEAHLQRLDAAISAFPSATQAELSQLLALLAAAPGRVALAGLTSGWTQASVTQVQASLQGMRLSSLALKQQAYHALRDLTNAAYFSDPSAWQRMGYPGPSDI